MRRKVLFAVGMMILLFIWGNSCLSRTASNTESSWVTDLLQPFWQLIFGERQLSGRFVRKLAHFMEFAALGFVLYQWAHTFPIPPRWQVVGGAVMTVLVALVDETIQIFSGRGSQIQDVWLDFAGGLLGILLALGINRIKERRG